MKKLKLKELKFKGNEVLTKSQLKKVLGGSTQSALCETCTESRECVSSSSSYCKNGCCFDA